MVSLKGVANPSLPANPTGGHLTTLDAHTGKILWTFANPMQQIGSTDKQALSQAPITVANGAVRAVWASPLGLAGCETTQCPVIAHTPGRAPLQPPTN